MNTRIFTAALLAGLFVVVGSCGKNHPGYKKTQSGLYYKFHVENKDERKANPNDIMTLWLSYKLGDSLLFSTSNTGQPVQIPLNPSDHTGDIYEALAMMHNGDSATFIIVADSFFMKTMRMPELPEFVKKGSNMFFDIKVTDIKSAEEMEKEKAEKNAALQAEEPLRLEAHLKANKITTAPMASGLYYLAKAQGSGRLPAPGDRMKAHFVISLLGGGQLYSTRDQGNPIEIEIGREFDNPGVTEGISLMRKGAQATLIVPSKLAFGEEGRGEFVPPYSTLIYEVEVVDLKTKAEYEKEQALIELQMKQADEKQKLIEKENIAKYMKEKNLSATPQPSGLVYIETLKGTGAKAEAGKKVKVHYTGTLLDGSKFDSSVDRGTPFEFTLGQGQVIRGWDEGITLMNIGGKATLIIPFEMGYGNRSMGPTIPAYSTLVFEVELIGVE